MAHTIVDKSTTAEVTAAIKRVNQTPGLRIKPGTEALWALYKAPNHTLPRQVIDSTFGAFDLHFGWFCRRVAEELGVEEPDTLALVDRSQAEDGSELLTLKPSVVAALAQAAGAAKKK